MSSKEIPDKASSVGDGHEVVTNLLPETVTSRIKAVKTFLKPKLTGSETVLPVHQLNSVEELTSRVQAPEFEANATNGQGETPLHLLVKRTFPQDEEKLKAELILSLLTYSKADLDYPDNDGNTPLHSAVQAGEVETVKVLLVYNASINALNSEGKTPLDLTTAPALQEVDCQEPAPLIKLLETCGAEYGKNVFDVAAPFSILESDVTITAKPSNGKDSLDLLAEAFTKIERQLESKFSEVLASDEENPCSAKQLAMLSDELKRLRKAGCRVLCMDGGGIRGLIQMEVLSQLERETGKSVTELFDWIVGTSTGGIVALGMVYAKKTLNELRQFYFKTRYEVFGKAIHGVAYDTDALIGILQTEMGGHYLNDVKTPKVLVAAVDKSTVNLKLRFFNNCFDDDYSTQEVWKVARYTSAAPTMFKELDDFVDGGVLAQNPSAYGLAKINDYYHKRQQKIPVSIVVSIGTGLFPDRELGSTDAQDFLSFGKHWFVSPESPKARTSNLVTLLGNAIVESELANETCKTMCQVNGIPYYRFNPSCSKAIPTGETDLDSLVEMLITTKTTVASKRGLAAVLKQLQDSVEENAHMLKHIKSLQS